MDFHEAFYSTNEWQQVASGSVLKKCTVGRHGENFYKWKPAMLKGFTFCENFI